MAKLLLKIRWPGELMLGNGVYIPFPGFGCFFSISWFWLFFSSWRMKIEKIRTCKTCSAMYEGVTLINKTVNHLVV